MEWWSEMQEFVLEKARLMAGEEVYLEWKAQKEQDASGTKRQDPLIGRMAFSQDLFRRLSALPIKRRVDSRAIVYLDSLGSIIQEAMRQACQFGDFETLSDLICLFAVLPRLFMSHKGTPSHEEFARVRQMILTGQLIPLLHTTEEEARKALAEQPREEYDEQPSHDEPDLDYSDPPEKDPQDRGSDGSPVRSARYLRRCEYAMRFIA